MFYLFKKDIFLYFHVFCILVLNQNIGWILLVRDTTVYKAHRIRISHSEWVNHLKHSIFWICFPDWSTDTNKVCLCVWEILCVVEKCSAGVAAARDVRARGQPCTAACCYNNRSIPPACVKCEPSFRGKSPKAGMTTCTGTHSSGRDEAHFHTASEWMLLVSISRLCNHDQPPELKDTMCYRHRMEERGHNTFKLFNDSERYREDRPEKHRAIIKRFQFSKKTSEQQLFDSY